MVSYFKTILTLRRQRNLDDVIYTGNGGGEVKYLQHTYTAVTFESFKTLTQHTLYVAPDVRTHFIYVYLTRNIM